MSFRKEKKFRLSIYELQKLKSHLVNSGMQSLFNAREINSVYFDTSEMTMFHESEEGILPRKKIRVRWYDNEFLPTEEVKISSFEGRFKTSTKTHQIKNIEELFSLERFDSHYGLIKPVLFISYKRTYFKYDHLRITFDEQIEYSSIKSNKGAKIKDDECVVEVKTHINCSDDYIEKIIPLPTARFSKYSRGTILHSRY
ncbi:VTC domain-containing protein [bacterium]|nr:VTC domain-containing protein [bacterium]